MMKDQLVDPFDTSRPTREFVETRLGDVFGVVERGECVFLRVYDGDRPTELLFAGYSYD